MCYLSLSLSLLFAATITARDIVFPASIPQIPIGTSYNDPLSGWMDVPAAVAGLSTFANIPHVFCLADAANEAVEKFDIAFLGAPFDTATTGRPGARFGPSGIRQGSRRIEPGGYSIYTGESAFDSWAKVVDCGDAPLTFLDNTIALKQLDHAHKVCPFTKVTSQLPSFVYPEVVKGRGLSNMRRQINGEFASQTPRIIVLGGDHTTTLSALRSTFDRWGPVSVIHFDSHIDTWDPEVLGGGLSHYAGVNHGTFLHIAHEEGLITNSSMHAGIRAPVIRKKGDVRNDVRCGFDIVRARDIDRIGTDGIIRRIKDRVAGSRVYISVDIDVLDPAFAPATGTAEVGGWSTRELLTILDGLVGLEVIGADVVEVAPIYDNPGETTLLAASEVAHSLLTLMVKQPVKP